MQIQVAIQGNPGSFHEIAARNHFSGQEVFFVFCDSFAEIVHEIHKDPRILGFLAIENTIAGSLLHNLELVRESGLKIIGECKMRISHHLAALPGTSLEQITEIASHPMALRQCEEFLKTRPQIKTIAKGDTAASAREIAENRTKHGAAICSRQAAERYSLEILKEHIETDPHNFTRFLAIADPETARNLRRDQEKNKASCVFSLSHTVGSLSQVLSVFAFYEMNLSKIQSFPLLGREWEYLFYVDFTFSDYAWYQQAREAVIPLAKDFAILGEYEEDVGPDPIPQIPQRRRNVERKTTPFPSFPDLQIS